MLSVFPTKRGGGEGRNEFLILICGPAGHATRHTQPRNQEPTISGDVATVPGSYPSSLEVAGLVQCARILYSRGSRFISLQTLKATWPASSAQLGSPLTGKISSPPDKRGLCRYCRQSGQSGHHSSLRGHCGPTTPPEAGVSRHEAKGGYRSQHDTRVDPR